MRYVSLSSSILSPILTEILLGFLTLRKSCFKICHGHFQNSYLRNVFIYHSTEGRPYRFVSIEEISLNNIRIKNMAILCVIACGLVEISRRFKVDAAVFSETFVNFFSRREPLKHEQYMQSCRRS